MLQLMCRFISSSCFMELCEPMLGAWSSLAPFAEEKTTTTTKISKNKQTKKTTDQNQLAGGKGLFLLLLYSSSFCSSRARTQGRSLEVRTETEAMEKCCFLARFLLLAQSAFVYFPRPRKDINLQFLRLYIKVCFLSLKLTLKAEI